MPLTMTVCKVDEFRAGVRLTGQIEPASGIVKRSKSGFLRSGGGNAAARTTQCRVSNGQVGSVDLTCCGWPEKKRRSCRSRAGIMDRNGLLPNRILALLAIHNHK